MIYRYARGSNGDFHSLKLLFANPPGDAFVTKPKDLSAPPPPKPAPAPPPAAPGMFGRPGLVVDDQPAPPQNQGFNFMWGGGQPAQPQPPAPPQQLDYAMGGLGIGGLRTAPPAPAPAPKPRPAPRAPPPAPAPAPPPAPPPAPAPPVWQQAGGNRRGKGQSMAEIQAQEAAAQQAQQRQQQQAQRQSQQQRQAPPASMAARLAAQQPPPPAARPAPARAAPAPRQAPPPAARPAARPAQQPQYNAAPPKAQTGQKAFGGPVATSDPKALETWSKTQLKKITGSDDLTLVHFCMTLADSSEIRQYLSLYLGSTPQVAAFANEFIQRKSGKADTKTTNISTAPRQAVQTQQRKEEPMQPVKTGRRRGRRANKAG